MTRYKLDVSIHGHELRMGDLGVTFQRTLRIPDDGRSYPLPPGLGTFPLKRVDDYLASVPEEWREHGGVFLPMYQREAMWICFRSSPYKPRAVKVGIGKVCAITGEPWGEELSSKPQSYVVTPPQPWLDGIASGKGTIRQFVAMPLGLGYTVEGQLTGEERFGGIQLKVFEPKPGRFPEPPSFGFGELEVPGAPAPCAAAPAPYRARVRRRGGAMGLSTGGRMKQKIYPDPHSIETWDRSRTGRVFVHIVTSELWREVTGEPPPPTPVTARAYSKAGLPWFELYDEAASTLDPTDALQSVSSVKEIDLGKSAAPLQDDDPVDVGPIRKLLQRVRDGHW